MKKIAILMLLLLTVTAVATVPESESIRQYFVCNGSTDEFIFTQPCNSSDDIEVYTHIIATGVESDPLVEDTDYTVEATGGDYLNGGVVTTTVTYASTYKLVIVREIKKSQETTAGAMTPITAAEALDKLTRVTQDLKDRNDRSWRLQESDSTGFDMEIPGLALRAETYPYFGNDGTLTYVVGVTPDDVPVSSFMETVVDDATAAAAMATLQGIPVINVMNPTYAAVADGDGSGNGTDNTAAFQAALTAAENGTLVIPAGTYNFYSGLTSLSKITIRGVDEVTLDFSGTDFAGSEIALTIAPSSGMTEEKTVIENIIFLGPETNAYTTGTPSTTTIGLFFDDVLGLKLNNVEVRGFKTGVFVTDTWPLTTIDCKFHRNYIGLELADDCTLGSHYTSRFLNNYYPLYLYGNVTNQSFISCDFEGAGNNAIVMDPDGESILGIQFINPYFEDIAGSAIVARLTLTEGATTGNVYCILISGGVWSSITDYAINNAAAGCHSWTILNCSGIDDIALDIANTLQRSFLLGGNTALTDGIYYWDDSRDLLRVLTTGVLPSSNLADGDATPSVLGNRYFRVVNDDTDITDFDDGKSGQEIILVAWGSNESTVIDDLTKINLAGRNDWIGEPLTRDSLTLIYDGTDWNETGRSTRRGGVHTATIELSSAEIKDLNSTPIILVNTPFDDEVIEFVSALLIHDAGTAYVEADAPDDLVIEYVTGQDITAAIDATGFLTVTDDEVRLIQRDLTAFPETTDLYDERADKIQIKNTGADYTTGTGTMTIKVTYRIHKMGL
jgi:hypothetical protein